jgi:predicted nucleic acid-binding protein
LTVNLQQKVVVLDNNVLIDFGLLDQFRLLRTILRDAEIVLSPQVAREEERGLGIHKLQFQIRGYDSVGDYELARDLKGQYPGLSDPDVSCIVLAKKFGGFCGSNEKLVRKACEWCKVKKTGTLGILEFGVWSGLISKVEASEAIDIIVRNGATISGALIKGFKHRVAKLYPH